MARRAKKKTDFGTVILHFVLMISLFFALGTGLRMTSLTPGYEWIRTLDAVLPASRAWNWHIMAGVALFGIALAYIAYISHAGLVRRIWPDKARMLGLFGRPRRQLSAINILLNWFFFLLLSLLLVTGCMMYLGHGGTLVQLHRLTSWGVLGFSIAHVAVQFAMGGLNQLLRVFRPSHLPPASVPFDPYKALVLALAPPARPTDPCAPDGAHLPPAPNPKPAEAAIQWRRGGTMLHANPLVVAIAAGFTGVVFLMAFDTASRDTLRLRRIAALEAPILDGDMADPAWNAARPIYVETQQGQNFDGTGATTIEVRAVHDGTTAYFSFIWDDPTRSLKHLPLVKKEEGWHVVQDGLDYEDENSYHDDSFAIALTTLEPNDTGFWGGHIFHIGVKPLPDKPASFSGRGLHYTNDAQISDVWHWKASRGGMAGWCDDAHIGMPVEPTREQVEGKQRYSAGLAHDAGGAMAALNFEQRPPGGYAAPIQPKRLPADLRQARKAMGYLTPFPNKGESDGAVWWLAQADSVPYSAEADARIPVGTLIPGVVLTGEPSGDRAHVRCAARWAAGRWTLEAARLLDTGGKDDVVLGNQTAFRLAAFDHSQIAHTRQIRVVRIELE